MNKIIFLSSFFVLISVSVACTKDEAPGVMPNDSFGMNADQVELYASIFAPFLSDVENGENEATKAVSGQEKILEDIDYFIEDGDTLMYAFNYQNDGGYLLIGSDNSSFPILAHSKIGNIHFDDIDRSGAFYYYLSKIKERIKYNLSHASSTDSEYYENWKDLGKDGYEYEITAVNSAPGPDTKARRDYSSGRAMVYPYTGYDLDLWCQTAGYNYYAPRKAKIGCPALAIGMLIYDTEQRLSGNHTPTMPYFDYKDKEAIPDTTKSSHVAQVLKQIADYIPNYSWGWANGIPSGARASDVLAGLKNLGYIKATMEPYDLDMLYKNIAYAETDENGTGCQRGVLLGADDINGGTSHIWFCDGYYEQGYEVVKKFLGIVIKRWNEYDDRLYMNWGWGPEKGNGWYSAMDEVWTSIDGTGDISFKLNTHMYINLGYYEIPEQ